MRKLMELLQILFGGVGALFVALFLVVQVIVAIGTPFAIIYLIWHFASKFW